jgi:hypothetical protein
MRVSKSRRGRFAPNYPGQIGDINLVSLRLNHRYSIRTVDRPTRSERTGSGTRAHSEPQPRGSFSKANASVTPGRHDAKRTESHRWTAGFTRGPAEGLRAHNCFGDGLLRKWRANQAKITKKQNSPRKARFPYNMGMHQSVEELGSSTRAAA